MFHHESWKPIYFAVKVKGQGHEAQKESRRGFLLAIFEFLVDLYPCRRRGLTEKQTERISRIELNALSTLSRGRLKSNNVDIIWISCTDNCSVEVIC